MSGAGASSRAMRWEDIDQLVELEQVIFGAEAWNAATWWGELRHRPRREYVVAPGAEDQVLGYAGLDHGGDTADVMTIGVSPAAQGRGLGRLLLDQLVTAARRGGAEALLLEVRADNDPAQKLYVTAGFEQISVRRKYYPDGVDAHVLRLLLDRPGVGDKGRFT